MFEPVLDPSQAPLKAILNPAAVAVGEAEADGLVVALGVGVGTWE